MEPQDLRIVSEVDQEGVTRLRSSQRLLCDRSSLELGPPEEILHVRIPAVKVSSHLFPPPRVLFAAIVLRQVVGGGFGLEGRLGVLGQDVLGPVRVVSFSLAVEVIAFHAVSSLVRSSWASTARSSRAS